MNVGVIGTGNMGTILIESFIESKALHPRELFIFNRTIEKAEALKKKYPQINLASDIFEIARLADLIFLCVKPLQFYDLLWQLRNHVTKNTLLISITSPISVKQIEEIVPCKAVRIIPSILNRAFAGPSLLNFGERCTSDDKNLIVDLIENISIPLEIDESITRVASDIVSCGPAFFSYLLQQFIEASVRQTNISEEQATKLATEMIIGLGKLLEKEFYSLKSLQEKVSVSGGITGEGIRVLEKELGDVFDKLFQATHQKFADDKKLIANQWKNVENIRK